MRLTLSAIVATLLFTTLSLPAGCDQEAGPLVVAHFALEVPQPQENADQLHIPGGLYNLQAFPAFVQAQVASAGEEPIVQTWPEDTEDISPGFNSVALEFEMPSGSGNELTGVAFTYENGRPYAFAQETPDTVDIFEGDTTEVDMQLVETDVGQAAGGTAPGKGSVWLVDLETGVRLDTVVYADGAYRFDFAPLGRRLVVVWPGADGGTDLHSVEFTLSEDSPAVTVDQPGV